MSAPPSFLTVEHVSKAYRLHGAERPVLKDINFTLGEDEIVGIVGASGCGKSTLLRLIVGLDRDYRGVISLNSQEADAALRIGMVFQDHRLYPWLTVEGNVALALDNSPLPPAGDRVIVMQPDPGRIREIVEDALPRPRDRNAPDLIEAKKRCLATLH